MSHTEIHQLSRIYVMTTSYFKLTGQISDNLRLVAAISESFSTINFSLTSRKKSHIPLCPLLSTTIHNKIIGNNVTHTHTHTQTY